MGKHIKQSTGSISITAESDGRHEYCFSNQMSTVVDKIVRWVFHGQYGVNLSLIHLYLSFNVHGVIYVDDDGEYPCFYPA